MVTVLDSFEDGDISEYGGDTGAFSTTTTDAFDGSVSLTEDGTSALISRTDKSLTPESSVPFGFYMYLPDDGSNLTGSLAFGAQSAAGSGSYSGYTVGVSRGFIDIFLLDRWDNGSSANLVTTTDYTIPKGTWFKIEVTQWTKTGDITATMGDGSGNVRGTISTTDTTYGEGGFGFYNNDTAGLLYDYVYKPLGLETPTNVQITDASTEDQLTVDWDDNGAAGYYVYRAEASGSATGDYTQVADASSPPYTDTGLEDGERYYYRVSSHD